MFMKNKLPLFISVVFICGCVKEKTPTYIGSVNTTPISQNKIFNSKTITKEGILKKVKLQNNNFLYKIEGNTNFLFTSIYELPYLNKQIKATFNGSNLQDIKPLVNIDKKRKYLVNSPLIREIE